MAQYFYKGYKISNLGYHQPDHCVWWEAVDKDGSACFHGNTLREVEMMINDYEWECKMKAKDEEIARLTAVINSECNKCGDCAKFGSDCNAGDIDGNEDCRACKKFVSKVVAERDAYISSLRALVVELIEMLEKAENKFGSFRGEYQRKYIQRKCRALVEKARGAVK